MYGAFYLTDSYNNSVAYVTPEFGGIQGHLMYSNGTDTDEKKWSHNSHYYGAGLTYNKDKLSVDVIYELLDHKGATDQEKTRLLNLGASYDFGTFKVFGAYEFAQHAALPGIEFAEEKMAEASEPLLKLKPCSSLKYTLFPPPRSSWPIKPQRLLSQLPLVI